MHYRSAVRSAALMNWHAKAKSDPGTRPVKHTLTSTRVDDRHKFSQTTPLQLNKMSGAAEQLLATFGLALLSGFAFPVVVDCLAVRFRGCARSLSHRHSV
jgi:hypothetical protein